MRARERILTIRLIGKFVRIPDLEKPLHSRRRG